MKILSIETSCDDTCISIMEMHGSFSAQRRAFGGKILANNSNSQIKTHIPYGGVFPTLAKREHIKNLPILLEKTLKQANLDKSVRQGLTHHKANEGKPVDLIAVTYGPGLEPCLWAGIVFAQELAKKWSVPLIPVNHMEGHILSVFGKDKGKFTIPLLRQGFSGQAKVKTPILSLLVSGGHTQLVLAKGGRMSARGGSAFGGNYEIIGETLDDAVGEAFDKVARMLGLPYPGGPAISKLAEDLREKQEIKFAGTPQGSGPRTEQIFQQKNCDPAKFDFLFSLPRPMLHSKNFDFSFSGLKTAVFYLIKKIGPLNEETKSKIALEFENAAIECLTHKTQKAIEKYKIKTLIVAGGVAANKHLRNEMKKLTKSKKIKLMFPTPYLCSDNSIMIGTAGYLNYIKNKNLPAGKAGKVPKPKSIKATGNLKL